MFFLKRKILLTTSNFFPWILHGRILSCKNKCIISLFIELLIVCMTSVWKKKYLWFYNLFFLFKFILYFLYHVKKNIYYNLGRNSNQGFILSWCENTKIKKNEKNQEFSWIGLKTQNSFRPNSRGDHFRFGSVFFFKKSNQTEI